MSLTNSMKTGIAHLPLHGGKAPSWLFQRMKRLAREIVIAIVSEYGNQEIPRKLSDPFWFQALGCVLGFDWHSSGVTTTTCGALKEGIKGLEKELGLFIAGGKGATSRRDLKKNLVCLSQEARAQLPERRPQKLSALVTNSRLILRNSSMLAG